MIVWQYGILACNTSTLKKMCFGELSWIWECCYSLDQSHKHHYMNKPIPDAESTYVVCEGFKSNEFVKFMSLSDSGQGCGASFPMLYLSISSLWLFLSVCLLKCLLNWGLRAGSPILEMALLIPRLETHSVICDLS